MEFPRQVYWSGLPCPSPGDLPKPGIEPGLPQSRQILYCLSHRGSPENLLGTTETSDTSGAPYSLTHGCFASFPSKETQTLPGQVKVTACPACPCSILEDPTPVRLLPGPGNVALPSLSALLSLSFSPSFLTQQMEASVSGMTLPQWEPEPSSPPCLAPHRAGARERVCSQASSFLSPACLPASRAVTQRPRASFPAKDRAWRCPLGPPGEWPSAPESDGDAQGWGGGFLLTGVEGMSEDRPASWGQEMSATEGQFLSKDSAFQGLPPPPPLVGGELGKSQGTGEMGRTAKALQREQSVHEQTSNQSGCALLPACGDLVRE